LLIPILLRPLPAPQLEGLYEIEKGLAFLGNFWICLGKVANVKHDAVKGIHSTVGGLQPLLKDEKMQFFQQLLAGSKC
jgi:hypothetical protein